MISRVHHRKKNYIFQLPSIILDGGILNENYDRNGCGIDVHQKTIICCILDGPLDTNRPKSSKMFGTRTHEQWQALN